MQIVGRTEAGQPNRWAVFDDDDRLIPEVNRFLEYLRSIERPDNSVRAAAYDLRAYCEFLLETGRDFDDVTNEVLAFFARWYRNPAGNVISIVDSAAMRTRSSTNRALASISSFYRFLGSLGENTSGSIGLRRLQQSSHTYKRPRVTVVDNVSKANPHRDRSRLGPRLPRTQQRAKLLTIQQVHTILLECRDRRDRLLIMLAFTTGMRIGQILGLRHEDVDTRARSIRIESRDDNPNGARSKGRKSGTIPITEQVNRLYIEYMHEEYGYIDSPYVFINFETLQPMTYSAADSVVQRLRRRTGNDQWSIHTLRHTFVTLSRRAGVPIDVVSNLVLHKNIQTTIDMYSHLDVEDLRRTLIEHGAWEEGT
ncbi:MAG: tyrosine-type recombinase/integrase [Arthrobacter sp.]